MLGECGLICTNRTRFAGGSMPALGTSYRGGSSPILPCGPFYSAPIAARTVYRTRGEKSASE
jgi:hypothetical protein